MITGRLCFRIEGGESSGDGDFDFLGQLDTQRSSEDSVFCEDWPRVFRVSMEDLIDPRCGAEPGVDWGYFHGLIMFEIEGFTTSPILLRTAPPPRREGKDG